MDSFRDHDALRPHLFWLDGALPSPGGASLPLRHADFADWRPVARGPRLPETSHDSVIDAWIWEQKSAPGPLWLGLGVFSPPQMFLRADDPGQLSALLDRFFLHPQPAPERPRTYELMVGIFPAMRDAEDHMCRSVFSHTMPLLLGTAATEGLPHPEDVEREDVLLSTFAARHSESEIHLYGWRGRLVGLQGRVVTARIAYAAAPDAGFVHAYNAAHSTEHPEDLPVDCIGLVHELPNVTPGRLEREIGLGSGNLPLLALVLAHDVPRAKQAMERWLHHPSESLSGLAAEMVRWLSDFRPKGDGKPRRRGKRKAT